MVGVTIGVGEHYGRLAELAARAVEEKTRLRTIILRDSHFVFSRLPAPNYLKLRMFDFVDDDSILYFDADVACLNPWRPDHFVNSEAIVAVAENSRPRHLAVVSEWGIPFAEYFNSGVMILNRQNHWNWLKETEQFIRTEPRFAPYEPRDQVALNVCRQRMGLKLSLLDRRYNWVDFGVGRLCHEVPVFMAHPLKPDDRLSNIDFFEGRYKPPFNWKIAIDEHEISKLKNRTLRLKAEGADTLVRFSCDGTIAPPYFAGVGQYWFVHNKGGTPVLAICSDKQIVWEFAKTVDGSWRSVQRLDPTPI